LLGGAIIAGAGLSVAALAATETKVKLDGDILPECKLLGPSGAGPSLNMIADIEDISKPGRKVFDFTVNCNSPFKYSLEAEHGALTHESSARAPRGFVAAVPYDVAVHIATDGAAIDDRCSGESIRAGQVSCRFSNSGDNIALSTTGRMTLSWMPGGVPLAGKYFDRVTITVAARM
jgi:hypothetical protein